MAKDTKKSIKKKESKPKVVSKDVKYKITKKNGKVMYRVGLSETEIKRAKEHHGNTVEIVGGE